MSLARKGWYPDGKITDKNDSVKKFSKLEKQTTATFRWDVLGFIYLDFKGWWHFFFFLNADGSNDLVVNALDYQWRGTGLETLGNQKFDSVFYLSKVGQMSTRN